ncbi:hypothetical protein Angca_000219, partial [Angiostrongylus cantonensis]
DTKETTTNGENEHRGCTLASMTAEKQHHVLEEKLKAKKVTEVGLEGQVKHCSVLSYCSFISLTDGKPDILAHQNVISKLKAEIFYPPLLSSDDPLEFDIVEAHK